MKKLTFILVLAILLGGGAVAGMSGPSYAQGYNYPPPPQNPYATPWVGPNTPWVYYNGDWFLNGILYYFFGPRYGWAPYYSYPRNYIVRPKTWYAPRWLTWYKGNPHYWETFQQTYPYWRGHRQGRRYDQKFYEQHRHGQPGEWQKGFRGHPTAPTQPGGPRPGPGPVQVTPPTGQRPTGPTQVAPPSGERPGPGQVTPPAGQRPTGPTRVAPPEGPKPGPVRVAPPEGPKPQPGPPAVAPPAAPKPGPAVAPPAAPKSGPAVAPPAGPQPGPAPAPPSGGQKPAPAPGGKPDKSGPGEEKR